MWFVLGLCNPSDERRTSGNTPLCSECFTSGGSVNSIISLIGIFLLSITFAIFIFSFDIPEESIKELDLITKIYLNEKLEKEYKLEDLF